MEDKRDRTDQLCIGDKSPYMLKDDDCRRFIICLKQEFPDMLAANQDLASSLGLDYD
ncbi:hypothetical protein KIN20_030003, partial [Parelaphostrongylus tenuis]